MKEAKILYNETYPLKIILLKLLCNLHSDAINENKEYINIKNAIIAGAFTSKIKMKNKKVYVDENVFDINTDLIQKWNDMSLDLEKLNFYIQDDPFYCYRVINNDSIIETDIGSVINRNPLPVSATFDINMASLWSANKDNFSFLKIELRPGLNYTIFDNLNERDSEIVLPPGNAIIEEKNNVNGVDIYTCSYHKVDYRIVKCSHSEDSFCKCKEGLFCIFTQREIEQMSKIEIKFPSERKRFVNRRKNYT